MIKLLQEEGEMPKVIDEDEVFKSVLEVLVKRGYASATTSEMAAAAKIHEATLFRKYGSKVGLIERAIGHLLSKAPLSKVAYTGDLQADLYAILEAYVATHTEYGEIMPVIFLEIPRYPELRKVLLTPLANIQGLANIIARYQRKGLLKKEPPLLSVNVLLAPILLNQIFQRANVDMPAPSIDLHEYVAAFLNGRQPATNGSSKVRVSKSS
jgi:AcrR family transcriptional regulator